MNKYYFYHILLFFLLNLIGIKASRLECKNSIVTLLNDRPLSRKLDLFQKILSKSDKVHFVDGDKISYLSLEEMRSLTSYTINLYGDAIVIGKNIRGADGKAGGSQSHVRLTNIMNDKLKNRKPICGGSLRFGPNATIYISGYHNKNSSSESAKRIESFLKKVLLSPIVRTTADKLSNLDETYSKDKIRFFKEGLNKLEHSPVQDYGSMTPEERAVSFKESLESGDLKGVERLLSYEVNFTNIEKEFLDYIKHQSDADTHKLLLLLFQNKKHLSLEVTLEVISNIKIKDNYEYLFKIFEYHINQNPSSITDILDFTILKRDGDLLKKLVDTNIVSHMSDEQKVLIVQTIIRTDSGNGSIFTSLDYNNIFSKLQIRDINLRVNGLSILDVALIRKNINVIKECLKNDKVIISDNISPEDHQILTRAKREINHSSPSN